MLLRTCLVSLILIVAAVRIKKTGRIRGGGRAGGAGAQTVEELVANIGRLSRREALDNGPHDEVEMDVYAIEGGATTQHLGSFLTQEKTEQLVTQGFLRRITQTEFDELPEGTQLYAQYGTDEEEEDVKNEGKEDEDDADEANEWPTASYACKKYVEGKSEKGIEFDEDYVVEEDGIFTHLDFACFVADDETDHGAVSAVLLSDICSHI